MAKTQVYIWSIVFQVAFDDRETDEPTLLRTNQLSLNWRNLSHMSSGLRIPRLRQKLTASVRSATSSFAITLFRWFFTVLAEML